MCVHINARTMLRLIHIGICFQKGASHIYSITAYINNAQYTRTHTHVLDMQNTKKIIIKSSPMHHNNEIRTHTHTKRRNFEKKMKRDKLRNKFKRII